MLYDNKCIWLLLEDFNPHMKFLLYGSSSQLFGLPSVSVRVSNNWLDNVFILLSSIFESILFIVKELIVKMLDVIIIIITILRRISVK